MKRDFCLYKTKPVRLKISQDSSQLPSEMARVQPPGEIVPGLPTKAAAEFFSFVRSFRNAQIVKIRSAKAGRSYSKNAQAKKAARIAAEKARDEA